MASRKPDISHMQYPMKPEKERRVIKHQLQILESSAISAKLLPFRTVRMAEIWQNIETERQMGGIKDLKELNRHVTFLSEM